MGVEIKKITVTASPDGRLRPADAAKYLNVAKGTLADWRYKGKGPRFIKRGGIFYRLSDLDDWLLSGEVTPAG